MDKKLLVAAIAIFVLSGLTFPLAALPSFLDDIYATTPTWWYHYLIIGGIIYFGALLGIIYHKKWAAYIFPVILLIDTAGISLVTRSHLVEGATIGADIVTGVALVTLWAVTYHRNKAWFK